jgi:hypothetical protein
MLASSQPVTSNAFVLVRRTEGKTLQVTDLHLKKSGECKHYKTHFFEDEGVFKRTCLLCGYTEDMLNWASIPATLKKLGHVATLLQNKQFTIRNIRQVLGCSPSAAWSYYATLLTVKKRLRSKKPEVEESMYIQPRTLQHLVFLFNRFGPKKISWSEVKQALGVSRTCAHRYHMVFLFLQETLGAPQESVTSPIRLSTAEYKPPTQAGDKERASTWVSLLEFSAHQNNETLCKVKDIFSKIEDPMLSKTAKDLPRPCLYTKRAQRLGLHSEYDDNPHIGLRLRHLNNLAAFEHPLILELLKKGTTRMADFGEKTKEYYLFGDLFGLRLRKLGAFLSAANTRSHARTDDIVNACFILCLKSFDRKVALGHAIQKLSVSEKLLEAVDLFFRLESKSKEA